jgi:hypothetical protein
MIAGLAGGLEKLRSQLVNPWDWAAAAAGGAIGLVVTAHTHALDGGTSITSGASAAVALRKAWAAARQRPRLSGRAHGLLETISHRRRLILSDLAASETTADSQLAQPELEAARAASGHKVMLLNRLDELTQQIELEIELWTGNKTSDANETFNRRLDEISEELRALFNATNSPASRARTQRRTARVGKV